MAGRLRSSSDFSEIEENTLVTSFNGLSPARASNQPSNAPTKAKINNPVHNQLASVLKKALSAVMSSINRIVTGSWPFMSTRFLLARQTFPAVFNS